MVHTQKGLREELVEAVCVELATHQVPDYDRRCNCGTVLYEGQAGSKTLTRHRAECIVDEVILPRFATPK